MVRDQAGEEIADFAGDGGLRFGSFRLCGRCLGRGSCLGIGGNCCVCSNLCIGSGRVRCGGGLRFGSLARLVLSVLTDGMGGAADAKAWSGGAEINASG